MACEDDEGECECGLPPNPASPRGGAWCCWCCCSSRTPPEIEGALERSAVSFSWVASGPLPPGKSMRCWRGAGRRDGVDVNEPFARRTITRPEKKGRRRETDRGKREGRRHKTERHGVARENELTRA